MKLIRRKKKNRRKIDVAEGRERAQRVARVVGRGLFLSALVAGGVTAAAWGALATWRWATTTPDFAIETVRFEGLAHATEEELLRLGALALGQNIWLADLGQAQQAMGLHPWVHEVEIERDWPRTLRVAVVEHQPAALLAVGGLYLVDLHGVPFKRALPGDNLDYPVITGMDREGFGASSAGREQVLEALALYGAWTDAGLEKRWPASEVRVEEDLGMTLIAADGAEVQMGFGDFATKVRRLTRVREQLAARGQRAARVDLGNRSRPGWVAVELLQ